MTQKRFKIADLEDLNLQELTEQEIQSLRGGMTLAEGYEGNSRLILPRDWDDPKPGSGGPVINNVPCSNSLNKNGHLPWCAVIL